MEPIIEVKDLYKKFGQFNVLNGMELTVHKGDVYGFLGPNGAGKSTTIRCMLSLIKPDRGQIRIFGKELENHRSEILSNIGCIIEKPDLYNELSAEKNLEVSGLMYGLNLSKKEIHEKIDMVGLLGAEQKKVGTFSQGMKQRIGLAQSLLHNPDLIVLDEPATGLDPQGIIDIRIMIKKLQTEFKKTIFLSSHDLSEIEQIANKMVIVNNGKALVEGLVADLLSDNDLRVEIETQDVVSPDVWSQCPFYENRIHFEDRLYVFNLRKDQIPILQNFLHQASIAVFAIRYKKSLEDFFLKITK
ncbi:MAG: ATP-binding cassette domain-containing protein [Chitinophagales bacterium]|nr:ATP-binding cassette domain-containing protein [Chitinophagales bacterium]